MIEISKFEAFDYIYWVAQENNKIGTGITKKEAIENLNKPDFGTIYSANYLLENQQELKIVTKTKSLKHLIPGEFNLYFNIQFFKLRNAYGLIISSKNLSTVYNTSIYASTKGNYKTAFIECFKQFAKMYVQTNGQVLDKCKSKSNGVTNRWIDSLIKTYYNEGVIYDPSME